jgi:hypothetical protein
MINTLLQTSPYTKQSNVTGITESKKVTLGGAWTCEDKTTTVYRILVGKAGFERPWRR